MKKIIQSIVARPQPKMAKSAVVAAELGSAVAIATLFLLSDASGVVVFLENLDLAYLFFPVALGSIALVIIAWPVHSVSSTTSYPVLKETRS